MTRDAAAIGAGLAPARPARPIVQGERIHVVGAAGAGASAAAILAHGAGAEVTGCDPGGPSPYSAAVEALGIPIASAHDAAHVTDRRPDRLAVTKALTAVDPDHPELAAARAAGIPVEPWQQVVADAATDRRLVAIAGTHGKSTTSGWLVELLVAAGADPSAFVGALLPARVTGGPPATARIGRGDSMVVEADEYAGNFDPYRPDVAVLTNAEWDHPDVFADEAAVVAAFVAWIERGPVDGTLVVDAGDAGARAVAASIRDGRTVLRYRLVEAEAEDEEDATTADLEGRLVESTPEGIVLAVRGLAADAPERIVRLRTAGRHNASNALAVAGAARALGIPPAAIVAGLEAFEGVGRRLERKGEAGGVVVYDDYGHHPTAIRATIAAVRQREPGRRLWAVYEPLTYHRTAALLDGFAAALSDADAVAVADIWAGRDPDTTVASAAGLAEAVAIRRPDMPVMATGSVEATATRLAAAVAPGDVVLVMGGGRSYRIGEMLLERLGGTTG
ncbi:MAG: UDP-N-acetylmuramate--L-alanine ligase [Candidatus Limnocylindria bacterium]